MWQEMRKHEKKLRGLIVDYKRRSERRKEYYERIKRDPAEFLQIWGRPAKIHLDPAIATAAESTLTPWRDDEETLIDRFDVRSHLDIIDEYALRNQQTQQASEILTEADLNEENACNYERYRVLIHNEATGVNEEQCLRDIETDEKFGAIRDVHHPAVKEAKKKKAISKKAEIGFVYEDTSHPVSSKKPTNDSDDDDDDDDDDDLDIEIDISQLTSENKASLNKVATRYGLAFGEFARLLILDREEMQTIRENRLEREQDAPVKGRRARRERRLAKERRIKDREFYPPNYSNRESLKTPTTKTKSKSRSTSPMDTTPVKEKIEFITAFGDDDTAKNDAKRKRPFEKSLLDECREAKKKAEPNTITIRTQRLVTPPRVPAPTEPIIPCRAVPRKSQVLLSTLQKLKEDSSPERRVRSDDEIPAIKIVKIDKKEEKSSHEKYSNDDDDDEEDDLQQYLKRKEARQRNQNLGTTPISQREKPTSIESATKSSSTKTPQEKLKRRMQSLIQKQFQKDKDQQRERQEREEKEREARESELRQSSSSSSRNRHYRSRQHSSSRSRTRSRSRSPIPRRHRRRSSSTSSSSSSSSSSRSSRRASNSRSKRKSSPVKTRSPTPEFLRQRFHRDHQRRSSTSSSSSSSSSTSKSDRSSSRRRRTDHK